jgi:hypothetical protein
MGLKTQDDPAEPRKVDPIAKLAVFEARVEARAILFAAGEFHLHEAVDALQAAAVSKGLVDEIGQDARADDFRGCPLG